MPSLIHLEFFLPQRRADARLFFFRRDDDSVLDAMVRALKTSRQSDVIKDLYMLRVRRADLWHGQLNCDNSDNGHNRQRDVIVCPIFNRLFTFLREILLLIDVAELRHIETSKIMNRPSGSVMRLSNRARFMAFERSEGTMSESRKKGGRDEPAL